MTADRYDVVVAGGGAAGCVLAARLSEERERLVCLVEAGPDYGPYVDGRWPAEMLDARFLPMTHLWEQEPEDRSASRARIIGGCSAHNACVVLQGAPADYDEWGPGWTYADVQPYLRRAERELTVRELAATELTPWHAAFADAGGGDTIRHVVNDVGGVRWNAAFAYLDPARARANLTILAETLVDRVLVSGNRAGGVVTDRGTLRADTVVLAAGAYGSPAILLRSGVGPESGLPVGEGLIDHVGVGMGWTTTESLQRDMDAFVAERPEYMAQVTIRARSRECPPELFDLFVFPAVEPRWEISAAVFAMKPLSRGRVRLRSSDPRRPPAIDHGFLSDERDAEILVEGVAAVRELVASGPITRYAAEEDRPGPRADIARYVREAARGFFHPVATCALGTVTDERARVHGFDNLFVGDASLVPSIPRANTHLTALAVAERVAGLV